MLRTFLLALVAVSLSACSGSTHVDDAQPGPQTATGEFNSGRTIRFSGHDWVVKSGRNFGPGPNVWSADNVFVDEAGALHLRIAQNADGDWACAEVSSTESFGWGRYSFEVEGALDHLPPEAVLGMFDYPANGAPSDTTSEIDIEIAQWGNPTFDRGNFTLWAGDGRPQPLFTAHYPVVLTGTYTTHAFEWRSDVVRFESRHGHGPSGFPIAQNEYRPDAGAGAAPRPVHLNFWLFRGKPPSPAQPLEVIVSRFTYDS